MAFQYPEAKISIIEGNGFYRIKAQAVDSISSSLASLGPGDLIPIDVGFSAIAVGPESDYENYELFYPDPTAPGGLQRIPFSARCPFVGRVIADNSKQYPGGDGEVAKAFVRIVDIGTVNGALTGAAAANRIAEALADIIVYTGAEPNSIPSCRVPNKRQAFIPIDAASDQQFFIPVYGRRLITMSCSRPPGGSTVTVTVAGLRVFRPLLSSTAVPSQIPLSGKTAFQVTQTILLASGAVPAVGDPLDFAYNADLDGNGYFDFLRCSVASDTNQLPSDAFRGAGVYFQIEVRD